jgi:hypothetical protein
MNLDRRTWIFIALALLLSGTYVVAFTDWLAPQPIEIASQIRPVIQPPRFGRRGPKGTAPADKPTEAEPAGVARVTFSLDGRYRLTSIRVFALNAQGEPGKKVWDLTGKSRELNSLMYGMNPAGMSPADGAESAAPLEAGLGYLLEIRAGRRTGSHRFKTAAMAPPEP